MLQVTQVFRRDSQNNWMGNSPIRSLRRVHIWEDGNQRVWMDWLTWYAKKEFPIVLSRHEFRELMLHIVRSLGYYVETRFGMSHWLSGKYVLLTCTICHEEWAVPKTFLEDRGSDPVYCPGCGCENSYDEVQVD